MAQTACLPASENCPARLGRLPRAYDEAHAQHDVARLGDLPVPLSDLIGTIDVPQQELALGDGKVADDARRQIASHGEGDSLKLSPAHKG